MGWQVMLCAAVQRTPSPGHLEKGEGYPGPEIDERKAWVETVGSGRGVGTKKSASRSLGDQEFGWHLDQGVAFHSASSRFCDTRETRCDSCEWVT